MRLPKLYVNDADPMLTDWWSSAFVRTSVVFGIRSVPVVCGARVKGARHTQTADSQADLVWRPWGRTNALWQQISAEAYQQGVSAFPPRTDPSRALTPPTRRARLSTNLRSG